MILEKWDAKVLNSAVSGQSPLVDSCKHGYRYREFVKEVCNHQLLNEVTVFLVSV